MVICDLFSIFSFPNNDLKLNIGHYSQSVAIYKIKYMALKFQNSLVQIFPEKNLS